MLHGWISAPDVNTRYAVDCAVILLVDALLTERDPLSQVSHTFKIVVQQFLG